jgi:hypothetical protein
MSNPDLSKLYGKKIKDERAKIIAVAVPSWRMEWKGSANGQKRTDGPKEA